MKFLGLTAGPLRLSFFVASTAAVLASFGSAGCESTIDVDDGGGEGECCLMDPQCPAGSQEVSECLTGDCFTIEACCTEKLCEPGGTCAAEPTCEPYEIQVATCEGSIAADCHSVTECGSTIFCEVEFCAAVPTCDEGDVETGVCPDDASCYQVELCGSVILCLDNGLVHGCPETPPSQGEYCDYPGLVCDYPINGDCYESWNCVDESNPSPGGTPGGQGAGGGGADRPAPSTFWQPLGTVCVDGNNE